jgi:hypothetical protein
MQNPPLLRRRRRPLAMETTLTKKISDSIHRDSWNNCGGNCHVPNHDDYAIAVLAKFREKNAAAATTRVVS